MTTDPQRRAPHRTAVWASLLAVTLLLLQAVPAWASDPLRGRQWGLDVIAAPEAWATARGEGVTIAVVDTGVDLRHPDLVDRLVQGRDFVDDDDVPQDEEGHGTHVAGIAAATGDNGRGVAGVAPAARIMPVRVLDADGSGSTADVEAGVRWAVANGADVVNLSLARAGQQFFGPGFSDVVREAWAAGVVVVIAAGNEFVLSSGFTDEPGLVVSATTRDDGEPDYSSGVGSARWGLAAPGGGCALLTCPADDDVLSTLWVAGASEQYGYKSGTSMAAPHVAGAVAVLLSAGASPQQAVDALLRTAVDLGPSGRDSTFGAGRIDLAAAVASVAGAPDGGAAPEPEPEPEPEPTGTDSGSSSSRAAAAPGDGGDEEDAGAAPVDDAVPPAEASPVPDVASPTDAAAASPSPAASPGTAALDAADRLTAAPSQDPPWPLRLVAGLLLLGAVAALAVTVRAARDP